jgi:hypothetical protein
VTPGSGLGDRPVPLLRLPRVLHVLGGLLGYFLSQQPTDNVQAHVDPGQLSPPSRLPARCSSAAGRGRGRDSLDLRRVLPLTKVWDWQKQRRMWRGLADSGLAGSQYGTKLAM